MFRAAAEKLENTKSPGGVGEVDWLAAMNLLQVVRGRMIRALSVA